MSRKNVIPALTRLGITLVACALLPVFSQAIAARLETGDGGFVRHTYEDPDGKHDYVVFIPHDYTPRRQWPVILFLHGAGERGSDGWRQTTVGLGPAVRAQERTFPFLVVFPQAEDIHSRVAKVWATDSADGRRSLEILDEVSQNYSVDKDHQIVTGWSAGGYGAWEFGVAQPDRWAAVVPISGGGNPDEAAALSETPVWAFHGSDDGIIPLEESRRMIQTLRDAGADPLFSKLRDVGHGAWPAVYASDALLRWLQDPQPAARTEHGGKIAISTALVRNLDRVGEGLAPAVEMPAAMYVHFGPRALEAISYSTSAMIPDELLQGELEDVFREIEVSGRTFDVHFADIDYAGSLHRVALRPLDDGRVELKVQLTDVVLTIEKIRAVGQVGRAVGGPMDIAIAHRRPIWLTAVFTPEVKNRRLRLQPGRAEFRIPRDNWRVSAPRSVRTEGRLLTQQRARQGIVQGVYNSRRTIEQQVEKIVPQLLAGLEEQLDVNLAGTIFSRFWPLPISSPAVEVRPHGVLVNGEGITLSLGITAFAPAPADAPDEPRRVEPQFPALEQLPRGDGLRLGVAGGVLQPLTELLTADGTARLHVLDVPYSGLEAFTDQAFLKKVLPETAQLPPDAEIWSELVLSGPVGVTETAVSETTNRFLFEVSGLSVEIRLKQTDGDVTAPVVVFDVRIRQSATLGSQESTFVTRALQIQWHGEPTIEIDAQLVNQPDAEVGASNLKRVRGQVAAAWTAATGEALSRFRVPDIALRQSRLRLSGAAWKDGHFSLSFDAPGIRLTNQSGQLLRYELRGPYSPWGGPYKLDAGEFHTIDVTYDVIYRHRLAEGGQRSYTLPAGSHSRFVIEEGQGRLYLISEEAPTTGDQDSNSTVADER